MIPFSTEIQQQINQRENRDKAKWLENYVKHDIQSLGVGIPEIRDIIRQAEREHRLTQLPISEQTEMLNDL
ncbi:MAG: DNA alkylation repair protein, partial [Calditrichaeota bacterium]|nr:DNA alkylation repair protein [Calditrichota bacterium]